MQKITQTILKFQKIIAIGFTTAEVWWSIDRRQFKTCLFIFMLLFFSPAAGGPLCLWPNAGGSETRDRRYMQAANVFAGPANRPNTDHPQKVNLLLTLCPLSFRPLSPYWPYSSNNPASQLPTRGNKSEKEITPFFDVWPTFIQVMTLRQCIAGSVITCNGVQLGWRSLPYSIIASIQPKKSQPARHYKLTNTFYLALQKTRMKLFVN